MTQRASTLRDWMVAGPLLAAAGFALGLSWRREAPAVAPAAQPFSFADAVERVRDGVVGISTRHLARGTEALDEIDALPPTSTGVSYGSGVVIDAAGLVLTAAHLVVEPELILVEVPGFGALEADVVGQDPHTDLAVLRLRPRADGAVPHRLCVPEFGESGALRQGDWVFSIGDPMSFRQSVSAGIVSYVGRRFAGDGPGPRCEHLQFSAPTHRGNSGSPVFDVHGRVVGVTTRTAPSAPALAFAVTSRVARRVVDAMESHGGHVPRGDAGLTVRAPALGVGRAGAIVDVVTPGLAAHRAGIQSGERVVAVDGAPLADLDALLDRLAWIEPDERLILDVAGPDGAVRRLALLAGRLGAPPPPTAPE